MGRGRPKTPIERMAARSPDGVTPGHRNLPAVVNRKPDHSIPVCSIDLRGRGETEWEKIWLAGWWLNREQDYHWVEMIVRAYMDAEEFRERVEDDGLVVTGYAGQVVAHPLIAEIRKCEATIQKCLQVLGFSPVDRAKLMLDNAKAENALQQMIANRRSAQK